MSRNGFTIGALRVPNAVVVAPMAGVSDLPFRELCLQLGAGMAVGEMLTADPKLRSSRKSTFRSRQGNERLRSIQIVGSEPTLLAEAARYNVDQGAHIIDINMGCPAKKVCKKAAGSALLGDETQVARILEAVVDASSVPVTLKIRTGVAPDKRNGVAIARLAESAGVQLLTVHGRTRADRFMGAAEYDTIAEIVDAVTLPVLANGDIDSAAKAQQVLSYTGAAGVMIGRATQGRPWLPGHIARALAGENVAAPSAYEQCQWTQRHIVNLHNFYNEYLGLRIARKHVGWFLDSVLASGQEHPEFSKRRFNEFTHCDEQHQFLRALADYLRQGHAPRNGRLTAMQYIPTTDPLIKTKTSEPDAPQPLRRSAEESIDYFLNALEGEPCHDLHGMVMAQVEEPLFAGGYAPHRGQSESRLGNVGTKPRHITHQTSSIRTDIQSCIFTSQKELSMSDANLAPVRRALLSVSDKTGITEFANALAQRGVEILSTGGTCNCFARRALRSPKCLTTPVSQR